MVQTLLLLFTKEMTMKTSPLFAFILLLISSQSFAAQPTIVTLVTDDYNPGSFYYAVENTPYNRNGDGAFSPYQNMDLAYFPGSDANKNGVIDIAVGGDWSNHLCRVKFNGITHQFNWVDNKPYTSPYTHKTYQCQAHYFAKYDHAFIYTVEVNTK